MTANPKLLKTLLLIVILATEIPGAVLAHDREEERTTLMAVLLDLEGGQATLGRPAMNGFNLALQHAKFKNASRIFTAFLDTKTDPAITLSAAKSVSRKVSAATGCTDNDAALTAGPVFQKRKIPFLAIVATDPSLLTVIANRMFLTPFGDNTQAAAAAELAKKEFGSTVAILFDNTADYTRTLYQYFRTRFAELGGGDALLTMDYAGGCSIASLGEQILRLLSRPAFVYLAGLPDCIGEVVASLRTAGVDQPIAKIPMRR